MSSIKLFGIAVILAAVAGVLLLISSSVSQKQVAAITNFEECAAAGNPIMESHPEQCRTKDGRTFVNPAQQVDVPALAATGCVVGGCSSEVCSDAVAGPAVSNCIYKNEFACYKKATCEVQADGTCGWTQTNELQTCIASASTNDGTPQAY